MYSWPMIIREKLLLKEITAY